MDHWGSNKSVPDWSQIETKMWFYYASDLYMAAGAEALHFGQMRLMTLNDPSRVHAWDLMTRVRARAAVVARRGFVLINAHVFEAGWSFNNTLLLDFHAFPSRPRDILARAPEAELRVSCLKRPNASSCCCLSSNLTLLSHCVPYRRSAGGVTPVGYTASAPCHISHPLAAPPLCLPFYNRKPSSSYYRNILGPSLNQLTQCSGGFAAVFSGA